MTSGSTVGVNRTSRFLFEDPEEIAAVRARFHRMSESLQIAGADISHPIGDFLEARDHQPLTLLDGLNVVRGLNERFMRAGIEPGNTAGQPLDMKLRSLQILTVDVGDLQFTSCRRLEASGNVDHLVIVEIDTGD